MGKELLDTLCAHLGTGRLAEEHIERMARLDALCPEDCRPTGMRLFRTMTLTEAEHDRLLSGEMIELSSRSHDCWSKDDARVRFILRHRSWQDPERPVSVILSLNTFPALKDEDFPISRRGIEPLREISS